MKLVKKLMKKLLPWEREVYPILALMILIAGLVIITNIYLHNAYV